MALLLNAGDTVSRSYSYTQPSPLHPSLPQNTGERTGNLCIQFEHGGIQQNNGSLFDSDYRLRSNDFIQLAAGTYTISGAYNFAIRVYDTSKNYIAGQSPSVWSRDNLSFTISDGFIKIIVANYDTNTYIPLDIQVMLNTGSTPLPYEPYGIKIQISSAGQTNNIYLGEVETTRKIKKLMLTGEENWYVEGSDVFYTDQITEAVRYTPICSHFIGVNTLTGNNQVTISQSLRINIKTTTITHTANDFKTYLAQQYAAGTPVCVWYVLATPQTGIVNEPLMKIGEYADTVSNVSIPVTAGGDTISVGTTVQPSEVTVNYKGWHPVADVHERNNGAWT